MKIRVMIDYENNAEKWWDNGGRVLWDKYEYARSNYDYLYLDEETAIQFMEEAEAIKGWNDPDAPAYAPFPLLYRTDDGETVWLEDDKLMVSDHYDVKQLNK